MPVFRPRNRAIIKTLLTVTVALLATRASDSAASDQSDARARDGIFGPQTLTENLDRIRRHVAHLDPQARYETLADYVLPSGTHASIRFAATFAPTPHQRTAAVPLERLRSAVFDMIDAANEAGALDELKTRVLALAFDNEFEQRQRIALLALVEMALKEFEAALPLLDELKSRYQNGASGSQFGCWPETLLLSVAVEHPEVHEPAATLLQTIIDDRVHPRRDAEPMHWAQHILALAGRLKHVQQCTERGVSSTGFGTLPPLKNWVPVSEGDEATYGRGFPIPHWEASDGQIEKLAGHRDEYLYFRSPLQGDFQVECDSTAFGWREGQVLLGGSWLWLQWTLRDFESGNLRGSTGMQRFAPQLSPVGDWIHHRLAVRNGVCSTFINGRPLQTQTHRSSQFPWVALRAPYWSATSFRNVRITGSPTIPDSISLSADPELSGWVRYHLDTVGGDNDDWHYDRSLGPEGGIVARRKAEFDGMFQESLLRYHRPMLEDGVIEYEFYYQPGECDVAPALDQEAFVLTPEGVRIHQITDGVWERSSRDPLNQSKIIPNSRCPLREGWNRMLFELAGDNVRLQVNGQHVATQRVPASGLRVFGLFHYSDQSKVLVRNMRWTGAWPKSIPTVADQQLCNPLVEEIDRQTATLQNSLSFHFDTRPATGQTGPRLSFAPRLFLTSSSDGKGSIQSQTDGLRMLRPPSSGYAETLAVPRLQVDGDFDIVAEFSNLTLGTPNNGDSVIFLTVVADDDVQTHCRVWHGLWQPSATEPHRQSQAEFNRTRPGRRDVTFAGTTPEGCNSGRLRIVRIGKRFHFMVSEGDSPNYRLLHSEDVFDEPLDPHNGVMLRAGTYDKAKPESGSVSVLWKSLTIRADKATLTNSGS